MKRALQGFLFLCLIGGLGLLGPGSSPRLARAGGGGETSLEDAVKTARDRVYPALVNIGVIMRTFSGGRALRMPAAGSGVIVSPAGHVVTNFHVAEDAIRITCTLPDGERIDADVVVGDPLTDLTILKLRLSERSDANKPIPFASIGDSSQIQIGDRVLALGNPLGLGSSVTQGIVSNTARVFQSFTGSSIRNLELSEGQPTGLFTRWIQHDAFIQHGNSGGPLVNLAGEVVGINELSMRGVNFAIPSNLVKKVLNRALTFGRIDRGWIGVTVQPVRNLDRETGALVASVLPGHPLAEAGIEPGDILLSVGGRAFDLQRFEDVPGFYAYVADLPIGSRQKVVYLRDGASKEADVEIRRMEAYRGEERVFPVWGVSARAITGPMAFARFYPDTHGVVITGVRPGKPPQVARPSLRRGDVITAIAGEPVKGLDDFATLQKKYRKKRDLLVDFRRGRRTMVTALDMTRKPPRRRGTELAKPWLGVNTQVMTPEVARALGMKDTRGFRVTWVLPETPASKGGLKEGDVITALDGDALAAWRIQDAELLRRRIEDMDIGSEATLTVLRDGKEMTIDVTLEEIPETAVDVKTEKDEILEYSVRDLTYRDKVDHHWPLDLRGVLVADVGNGGWASVAGLGAGDLLVSLQGTPIPDVKTFKKQTQRIAKKKPKRIRIFVRRGRVTTFIFVEPLWPKD
ncbi:MAG: PDZ domain-containing protein [Planctomycetota bacterium]